MWLLVPTPLVEPDESSPSGWRLSLPVWAVALAFVAGLGVPSLFYWLLCGA